MKADPENQEIRGGNGRGEENQSLLPAYGLAEDILKVAEEERSKVTGAGGPGSGSGPAGREEGTVKYVTFFLGKEEYALPISEVQEIDRVLDITRVPNAPHYVRGVVNLRGKIIPVIELKQRLNLGEADLGKDSRIVVAEHGPKLLGLIVDRVSQVLNIAPERIEAAPAEVISAESNYIKGVAKLDDRMIIVLDLAQVVGKGGA